MIMTSKRGTWQRTKGDCSFISQREKESDLTLVEWSNCCYSSGWFHPPNGVFTQHGQPFIPCMLFLGWSGNIPIAKATYQSICIRFSYSKIVYISIRVSVQQSTQLTLKGQQKKCVQHPVFRGASTPHLFQWVSHPKNCMTMAVE